MTNAELMVLLKQARIVLGRYMFDDVDLRDDVAEICAKIDDAIPTPEVHQPKIVRGIEQAA